MNIPNRASRHQAMREAWPAGVSVAGACITAATRSSCASHMESSRRLSSVLSSPRLPVGIRVRRQTLGLHRDAVARRRGHHVMAIANHDGVHKVLVQVIHVLDDAILERPTDAEVVEDRK